MPTAYGDLFETVSDLFTFDFVNEDSGPVTDVKVKHTTSVGAKVDTTLTLGTPLTSGWGAIGAKQAVKYSHNCGFALNKFEFKGTGSKVDAEFDAKDFVPGLSVGYLSKLKHGAATEVAEQEVSVAFEQDFVNASATLDTKANSLTVDAVMPVPGVDGLEVGATCPLDLGEPKLAFDLAAKFGMGDMSFGAALCNPLDLAGLTGDFHYKVSSDFTFAAQAAKCFKENTLSVGALAQYKVTDELSAKAKFTTCGGNHTIGAAATYKPAKGIAFTPCLNFPLGGAAQFGGCLTLG